MAPLSASAYRPFNSTDAAVAERGQVEIELGPVGFVKEGPDRSLAAPSLVLNWGFAQGGSSSSKGATSSSSGHGSRRRASRWRTLRSP